MLNEIKIDLKIKGEISIYIENNDLSDFSIAKFNALTSTGATVAYKVGVKFEFYQKEHQALQRYDINSVKKTVEMHDNFSNSNDYNNILISNSNKE